MVKATVNKASGTLNAVKADSTTDKNADGTYNVIVKRSPTPSLWATPVRPALTRRR